MMFQVVVDDEEIKDTADAESTTPQGLIERILDEWLASAEVAQ